jgi:hypothetical protein
MTGKRRAHTGGAATASCDHQPVIRRIVSGGQTGVDRAALDVARELGIPCGGWCPRGRLAEDGSIDPRYPLDETPSPEYAQRTLWNVRDSDGTLVLMRASPRGGTAFTLRCARRLHRPALVIDLSQPSEPASLRAWAESQGIATLNVAGPRESTAPGIYCEAVAFLRAGLRGA